MGLTKTQRDIKKLKKIEDKARKLRDKLDALELEFCALKTDSFIFSKEWYEYCQKNNLNIYYSFQDSIS